MEEPPQKQPFLDRPVGSLFNAKIGTFLKAYLVWIGIELVIFLIGLFLVLGGWHSHFHPTGVSPRKPGNISWSDGAGETVTPAEYVSVRSGDRLKAVRARFGEPATTGPNPLDEVSGAEQTCLGYRSSASDSTLFLFCFDRGRLIGKQEF